MTSSSPETASQAALASQVASLLPALAPAAALENEVRYPRHVAMFPLLTNR